MYELLDSDVILLFVDPKYNWIWVWQGRNTTTRMKFISARIASSIRDRYGVDFKLSSVDEGKEPVGFKIMAGLEKEIEYPESQTRPAYEGTEEDLELLKSLSREKKLLLLGRITPEITEENTENIKYCKYCGSTLAKGESNCHVCGNKVK